TPPRHRARCTHLQTQPGRIQPIDSSQLARRYPHTIAPRRLVAKASCPACSMRAPAPEHQPQPGNDGRHAGQAGRRWPVA
ncbi:hypothetical protein, partial [Bordetella pertussis]